MEIYKDSGIYKGPSIYESGAGGGGAGVPYLKKIIPTTGVKVVDENGYIGGDFFDYYNDNNFAIVVHGADYSNLGLGTVSFTGSSNIGGREYRTVTISGVTWLAENLDYKFRGCGIGGSGSPSTPNAWYYDNDEATYGIDGTKKCGLLYNWYAVNLLNENRNYLIPGWHVPTIDEWMSLANIVGGDEFAGKILKAADVSWAPSWDGTDDYGFGAIPAGARGKDSTFKFLASHAYLWSDTLNTTYPGYVDSVYFNSSRSIIYGYNEKDIACSLRLVKD